MTKHKYIARGISKSGEYFIGTCISKDIIAAISLFREIGLSVHDISRKEQVNANEEIGILVTQLFPEKEYKVAKGVVLKTDQGIMLMGAIQCSNGAYFDAEGCFKFCNVSYMIPKHQISRHQANKLIGCSTTLSRNEFAEYNWWENRANFIDVEIPFEIDQSYHGLRRIENEKKNTGSYINLPT